MDHKKNASSYAAIRFFQLNFDSNAGVWRRFSNLLQHTDVQQNDIPKLSAMDSNILNGIYDGRSH